MGAIPYVLFFVLMGLGVLTKAIVLVSTARRYGWKAAVASNRIAAAGGAGKESEEEKNVVEEESYIDDYDPTLAPLDSYTQAFYSAVGSSEFDPDSGWEHWVI